MKPPCDWPAPPQMNLPLSDFVEMNCTISPMEGPQAGPVKLLPHQRSILEAIADDTLREVIWIGGGMRGMTQLLTWCQQWGRARNEPQAFVYRTRDEARTVSRLRYGLEKDDPDVIWALARPLFARPVKRVYLDNPDGYPSWEEGDIAFFARRRTQIWPDGKLVAVGVAAGRPSRIAALADACSVQARWKVPCPHCHAHVNAEWQDTSGISRIVWETSPEGSVVPGSVAMQCRHCMALFDFDIQKNLGRWHFTESGSGQGSIAFDAGLYMPWMPLEEMVRGFLQARSDPPRLAWYKALVLGVRP